MEIKLLDADDWLEAQARRLLRQDHDCQFEDVKSEALGVREICYGIFVGAELVGFLSYRWGTHELSRFFIAIKWRREGVGAEAVKALMVLLASKGVKEIKLVMVESSEVFWSRALAAFGYKQEGDSLRVTAPAVEYQRRNHLFATTLGLMARGH